MAATTPPPSIGGVDHPMPDPTRFGSGPWCALRPGRADAVVVLVLRLLRAAWIPLTLLGLTIATITGRTDEIDDDALDSVDEYLGALWSPLVFVVVAIVIRLAVGTLSNLAAAPLSRQLDRPRRHGVRRLARVALWRDRYRVAKGFARLRATVPVQLAAVERLGPTGRTLRRIEIGVTWSSVVWVITWLTATALTS